MVVPPEKQMYEVIANVQAKLESQKRQFLSLLAARTGTFMVFLPLIVVFLTSLGVRQKQSPAKIIGVEPITTRRGKEVFTNFC
jgi:hypothetical protein